MLCGKYTLFAFIFLCLVTGFGYAEYDASLPEYYIPTTTTRDIGEAIRVTPPLIGSFAAPDGAMRGLAYDGQYLWAANSGDGNSTLGPKIYRLDPDSGTVINAYNGIINHPCGLAWDGQYLWHSTYIGGAIYQLDTLGLSIIKTFAAPTTHPFDLAWDGNYLYAVKGNQPYISVIDTSTGLEVDSIEATYSSPNVRPFGLTLLSRNVPQLLTCDGNYGSNLVNGWNLYAGTWVDQWAGEPTTYPSGLAFDSVSERLWVSCYERDSIYIYDVSQVGITETEIAHSGCFQLEAKPNPFTSSTDIRYQISDDRYSMTGDIDAGICIYDVTGYLVREYVRPSSVIGYQLSVRWDGSDNYGKQLSAGVYFLRLRNEVVSVKLVKLK